MKKKLNKFWLSAFLTKPNNLWALRISLSVFVGLLIFAGFNHLYIGLIIGLGIIAAALAENDIHLKSAIRSTFIISLFFFIFSSLAQILYPFKILFGLFLVVSTFSLTILGGYKPKYASITFGTILIIIYTILVFKPTDNWYFTPLIFLIGTLIYMSSTIIILLLKPYQNVKNEIAHGYRLLAKYLKFKAKFFPSSNEKQEEIRNELALINIELFTQTEKIKSLLDQFTEICSNKQIIEIQKFISQWNKLQNLHERATSSHEPYNLISENSNNPMLVIGFGKMLNELADACEIYAQSILNNEPYQHPNSLEWTNTTIRLLSDKESINRPFIRFLYKNISEMSKILENNKYDNSEVTIVKNNTNSFRKILSSKNRKFRHATRLSICLLTGYIIMNILEMGQDAWIILTSLLVCQQTYNATRQRFFRRITGTLLGVLLGIVLTYLIPTTTGQILILLVSVFLFFKFLKSKYIFSAIFVTIYVLEVFNLTNNTGISVMTQRIVDTLIGSILAYLSIRFIWVEWQYKNLKTIILNAVIKNKEYLQAVMDCSITSENYLQHQINAHKSDNQLTEVWKEMRFEPKSKQKTLTNARNFTYLNHTLLSYISAFGVHRHDLELKDSDIIEKDQIIEILDDITSLIQGDMKQENCKKTQQFKNLFLNNILNTSLELKEHAGKITF